MKAGQWAEWRDFTNAVWDDDRLVGNRLLVAVALSRLTDASGCAVFGAPTLADKAGVSRATLWRCMNDLVRMGYVERVNRTRNGKTLANRYRLLVPKAR